MNAKPATLESENNKTRYEIFDIPDKEIIALSTLTVLCSSCVNVTWEKNIDFYTKQSTYHSQPFWWFQEPIFVFFYISDGTNKSLKS
jgi:hypothetical protein